MDNEFRRLINDLDRFKRMVINLEKDHKKNYESKLEKNRSRRSPLEEKKIVLDVVTPVEFWKSLRLIKNPDNSLSYLNICNFCLSLLSLPHSNAEPERVFSQVNLNKTDLRNQLLTETNESLLHAKYGFVNSNYTLETWAPSKQMIKLFSKDKETPYEHRDEIVFQD
jgi:hypothetical protein